MTATLQAALMPWDINLSESPHAYGGTSTGDVPHPASPPSDLDNIDLDWEFDAETKDMSESELYDDLAHMCDFISKEDHHTMPNSLSAPLRMDNIRRKGKGQGKYMSNGRGKGKLEHATLKTEEASGQIMTELMQSTDFGMNDVDDLFDDMMDSLNEDRTVNSLNEFGCYSANSRAQVMNPLSWNSNVVEQIWLEETSNMAWRGNAEESTCAETPARGEPVSPPTEPGAEQTDSKMNIKKKLKQRKVAVKPRARTPARNYKVKCEPGTEAIRLQHVGSQSTAVAVKQEVAQREYAVEYGPDGRKLRRFVFDTAALMSAEEAETWRANRAVALARFRQKKAERRANPSIYRYKIRKKIANKRPRVKGRFVKTSELVSAASQQATIAAL